MTANIAHPYDELTPDCILNAIESVGFVTDARILALNSYENRVYQVGIEDETPVIVKFYRPERWSKAQIEEEHAFLHELADLEIPVVAPLIIDGKSVFHFEDFLFTLFPRRGGRRPELEDLDNLLSIGRYLGRMHACGASRAFEHRPTIAPVDTIIEARQFLLEGECIEEELREAYESLTQQLVDAVKSIMHLDTSTDIRLHGDCHASNILWRDDTLYFVDFDDCRSGPAVQDLWLLLWGDRATQTRCLSELLEGYQEFYTFNPAELRLIESLRTARIVSYAAWLAKRWSDPAFPMHFPWFNTTRYWSEHILALREQLFELQSPPLSLF